MAYPLRNGNSVKFLMDGEEIFSALKAGFDRVAAAPRGTPHTYVRMAFWLIAHNIRLGNLAQFAVDANSLIRHVGLVLRAGHDADLILWYPNMKARLGMKEQPLEHDALARNIGELDLSLHRSTGGQSGRGRVYRERYEGLFASSQHQKIAIFSVNGQRTVVLGGLNMAHRYFDNTRHDVLLGGAPTSWHDTAIELKGPATDDVEDEWIRRWRRVIDIADATVPTERLYNHLTARGITDQWKQAHAADIAANPTAQVVVPAGAVPHVVQNVPVQVALTRSSATTRTRVTDIRERLLALIGQANQRVYLENNQLTDPDLVRAIYRRKQAVPGLQVVIVTNPSGGGVGYLTRRAWMHMALRHPSCRSVVYASKKDPTGQKVVVRGAGPAPAWQVEDNYTPNVPTWHQWLEDDGLRFAKTSAGHHLVDTKKKKFHEVLDVDVDFHFYTPASHTGWVNTGHGVVPAFRTLCIHSKLAVVDDYLICGSSNWTYRSLQYDGEISLFMRNNALADAALARLLGHYDTVNAVNLGNIEATTRATADAILAAGAPAIHQAGAFVLLPLEYRPGELGPSSCLFWGDASPAHSTVDRLRNARERLARVQSDLPDWTWW
ncbi:hypothetical protein CYFUS_006409 [Cystobacter fuscus]|uniref:PLD phosphodiesterase domain-containing protein n=1 Tax=Cystobacter fuscus TaxID=43 RepID=A0A250JBQ9_9BACT|nr:phospholipase D-like domain-containing protein [Cystobacter fuscus]ATB40947.1 hypothetical protein CYFUS_006409 [Cystobacter fuscus]